MDEISITGTTERNLHSDVGSSSTSENTNKEEERGLGHNKKSGVASVASQTPYQIFRNATETSSTKCLEIHSDCDDEESSSDAETNGRDKENRNTKSNNSKESKNSVEQRDFIDAPTATVTSIEYTNKAGVLSPNAMEIRQNARTLLMRQPHNKRKIRRPSLQTLSLSSLVNKRTKPTCTSDSGMHFLKPTNQLSKQEDLVDIKEELESDLEEIHKAARDIAHRAAEVGGEAIEAFEAGLETISMGARRKMRRSLSAFGQLWD